MDRRNWLNMPDDVRQRPVRSGLLAIPINAVIMFIVYRDIARSIVIAVALGLAITLYGWWLRGGDETMNDR